MGLLQGALSIRRFLALGPVPGRDDLCGGLARECYKPFRDGAEEEKFGWADWRNPLVVPADPDWVFQDRFALFALRTDTRRVPPMLLRAHTELRIQRLMKEKDLAFLGREARVSLQDEVKAELLRKVLPTPRVAEVAWDLKEGLLWTTASNAKMREHLTALCMKSFGVELQPMAPLLLAGRLAPGVPAEALMALEPFDLGGAGA
jgi:DNA recombination-dependent growth factor C